VLSSSPPSAFALFPCRQKLLQLAAGEIREYRDGGGNLPLHVVLPRQVLLHARRGCWYPSRIGEPAWHRVQDRHFAAGAEDFGRIDRRHSTSVFAFFQTSAYRKRSPYPSEIARLMVSTLLLYTPGRTFLHS